MANTYTLISSNTVGAGGVASITFSSIPSTYTDLLLVCSTRITTTSGVVASLKLQCNGVDITGRRLGAEGNPMAAYSDTNATAYTATDAATASTFNNTSFYIPNYGSTTTFKSVSIDSVTENNAVSGGLDLVAGIYSANTAITSLTILNASFNLMQYSSAYLYGISKS
tara:strand:- start:300 stop:803 length:504 start_codon:yes stop_codon:yes gene_type:complete